MSLACFWGLREKTNSIFAPEVIGRNPKRKDRLPSHTIFSRGYCWWKKSCTSWYGEYPIIYRVSYMSGGAGFLNHQQYVCFRECNLIECHGCEFTYKLEGSILLYHFFMHVDDLIMTAASKMEVFVEDICLVLGWFSGPFFRVSLQFILTLGYGSCLFWKSISQLYMIFGYNRVELQQYYWNPTHVFPWPVVGQHKDGRAHHPL